MSSSSSTYPPRPSVIGLFRSITPESTSATLTPDLEAQAARAPSPPPSAVTRPASTVSVTNAFDDFFGASANRESRHDTMRLSTSSEPPAYDAGLPTYHETVSRPRTFAEMCYKSKIQPFAWIFGMFILFSSQLPIDEHFMPNKNEWERQRARHEMRTAELQWARKCAAALGKCMLVVAFIVFIVVIGVLTGRGVLHN